MGEPPPLLFLLLLLSLAGHGAAAAAESNFQQLLPSEEPCRCLGKPWPIPQQESKTVVDARIAYNQSILHSGPHRPFGVAEGEYQYCPPERWLHNLKQGGVAFLYHPCAHASLRGQLTLLARACLPNYILTPHGGLTQEWPLALVAWGATLQMAKVELTQAVAWLKQHAAQGKRGKPWAGTRYRRLLKRPAVRAVGRDICPAHRMQVLQKLFCRLDPNRRRRELQPSDRKGAQQLPLPHKSGARNLAVAIHGQDRATVLTSFSPNVEAERKDIREAVAAGRGSHMDAVPRPGLPSGQPAHLRPGTRPSGPTTQTAGGAAGKLACPCLDGDHNQTPGQHPKAAKIQEAGGRGRTPRTEEAAWAASALTFLLILLTLAILYTRLYRNCRRGQSLYWRTSDEDGRDTVATIIKRRILSAQSRRKKRPRRQQQQQRALLQMTSSESSE